MSTVVWGVVSGAISGPLAFAQGAPSGFELALHGTEKVLAGRPARFRGIAYKVRGLAELHELPAGKVRARYQSDPHSDPQNDRQNDSQSDPQNNRQNNRPTGRQSAAAIPWQSLQADAHGFFQIDVPIPSAAAPKSILEVSVGDGSSERTFTFPLKVERPWLFDLLTDRNRYEPGETVQVWGRLRDQRSRRPLVQQVVTFTSGTTVLTAATDESGVAAVSIPIPKTAVEGSYAVQAELDHEHMSASYSVGTRAVARLWSEAKVTPETAQPGQPVEVRVTVTAASGAPVRNAVVVIHLDSEQTATVMSDAQGLARATLRAPAYTAGDIGTVRIKVEVQHPAYGAATAAATLRVVVPLSMEAEAIPPNGGLVPELDGRLYFTVQDGSGSAPPPGTAIEVTGAAVAGGKQQLKTDRDGIAVARTKLPPGAATVNENGASTTVKVRVDGPVPRIAALIVPVHLQLDVVPTVGKLVVAPGDSVPVTLARRRSAIGRPVVVELISDTGIVDTVVVDSHANQLTLRMPPDRVGVMRVRARPLLQSGTVEGEGGVDALLVRPPRPSFPELTADRALYDVRETAQLTLKTRAGAGKLWGAVLVRDLALHQGERPFTSRFLTESFERAVLDPDSGVKDPFLRTVMAAYIVADKAPQAAPALVDALGRPLESTSGLETADERQVLRDPYPLADELKRRGVAKVMQAAESALGSALDGGTLDELTVGRGVARRFRPTALAALGDVPATLGDGELTLTMLQDGVPGFTYHNVARRIARARLVKLLVALSGYLDPGDDASPIRRAAAREPHGRWLARMVARGLIRAEDLTDPWGGRFALRPSPHPSLILAREAVGLELGSAGPDGAFGTADDVRDVFARVVPAGTPYAIASGEDALMERLSYLSPGENVLTRLLEAYKRVAAEVLEEQRGEAVSAQISEGAFSDALKEGAIGLGSIGTIGHGSGAGGSGYGSKGGHLSSHGVGVPTLALAQLVREKFPPTLLFVPSQRLDASGVTPFAVKLSDAVTTYVVEAIVWSADGWTWSASTQLHVDKKTVVDAPVPRYAMVGDSLLLPVRVRNSGLTELRAGIVVSADGESAQRRSGLLVPPSDATELSVPLMLTRPLEGKVLIGLESAAGVPLDAVRRPLTVLAAARRVRQAEDMLVRGTGTLTLEVPATAVAREGAEVTVQVGLAMFGVSDDSEQVAWREAWLGRERATAKPLPVEFTSAVLLASGIGVNWTVPAVDDKQMATLLTGLSRVLGKMQPDELAKKTRMLLALAPAARQLAARSGKAADLESMLRALRKDLTSSVAMAKEDPELLASLAAALAATAPTAADLSLVRELVRRVRRSEVRVGSDTWIAASGSRRHAATAFLALAELQLGEPGRAFERVRTLARIEQSGGHLDPSSRAIAHLVAALLAEGPEPTTVRVELDDKSYPLVLTRGAGLLPAAVLAQPGRHRIHVTVPGGHAAVYVRATTEYALPWELTPARPGSLQTTIEGTTRARDQLAALELVVHNRSPRTIGRPVLELSLPAGAELDEEGRRRVEALTIGAAEATRGTLHLELRSLPPGGTQRLPLPLRWSVAGHLGGLGVAAYPADQTEDVFILKPRHWDIAATEPKP